MNDFANISRRDFIKLGSTVGALGAVGMGSNRLVAMEQKLGGEDYSATTGAERQAVPYTCLACNIEDGGVAYVENGRVVKLEGNMDHPNTRGKLCAKGNAGFLHIYDPDRIMTPLLRTGKRGEGRPAIRSNRSLRPATASAISLPDSVARATP